MVGIIAKITVALKSEKKRKETKRGKKKQKNVKRQKKRQKEAKRSD